MSGHRPTRAEARAVACPACFARPGEPCCSTGKVRKQLQRHHIERVRRYRDGLFVPQPPVVASDDQGEPND